MNFECPICNNPYSELQKPKSIPCGHTLCEPCINSLVKNNSIQCSICLKSFENINSINLPIIYQLINKPERKPNIPKQVLKSEFTNSIAKVNEVFDQIKYLNYVKTQISETFKKHIHTSITQITQEMNKILKNLVDELNNFIQNIYQQIKISFDLKTEEIEKINNEIDNSIALRNTLSGKIREEHKQKISISDEDLDKFIDFDYPLFDLKFETYQFNIGLENQTFPFKDLIGKIQSPNSINYRFNSEEYIKHRDQNNHEINLLQSSQEIINLNKVLLPGFQAIEPNLITPSLFNSNNSSTVLFPVNRNALKGTSKKTTPNLVLPVKKNIIPLSLFNQNMFPIISINSINLP